MDDYIIDIPPDIAPNIKELLKEIGAKAKENGMNLSPTKTKYIPLTKSFRYCKIRFTLHENGVVTTKGSKKSAGGAFRRMRMFK